MGKARQAIDGSPALIAWRNKMGLSQIQAADVFRRTRRGYQNLEIGNFKEFPLEIDDIARLYEIDKKRAGKKRAE